MDIKNQYLSILSEIIAMEGIVFGFDIVILKAQNAGLILDDKGNVIKIKSDAKEAVRNLIKEFVSLGGQTARDILNPIFEKYPLIES